MVFWYRVSSNMMAPEMYWPRPGGRHQELAVCLAVGLRVLQADGIQALAAGGVGLVHGQDAVAGGRDLVLQPSQHPRNQCLPNPSLLP